MAVGTHPPGCDSPTPLWWIVDRACDKGGLAHIRPYDLRHSHASLLIDLGAYATLVAPTTVDAQHPMPWE